MNCLLTSRAAWVLTGLLFLGLLTGRLNAQEQAKKSIRVMSYNIHHGEGIDGKIDLERIANVIKEAKADIVGLQEIDRGVRRTAGRDLIKELADLTAMEFFFEKNTTYQGGDYGNAILSKYPFLSKTNTHYKMLRPKEQRGLQQVVVDVNGRKLLFLNTHIDYREQDEERMLNVSEIRTIIEAEPKLPLVMVGDFNSFPDSRVHNTIKEFVADAWETKGQGSGFTYHTQNLDRRIDYIFYKAERLDLVNIWIPPTIASDHLPLVAEFTFR